MGTGTTYTAAQARYNRKYREAHREEISAYRKAKRQERKQKQDRTVAANLRALMEKHDIDIFDLAYFMAVDDTRVAGWLDGSAGPTKPWLKRIADMFRVSVEDLTGEESS